MVHKITVELDRSVFRELKALASEDGVSVPDAAAGLIEDFFDERENPPDDTK